MIFLTVGTEFPFDRLINAIDKISAKLPLGDHVLAQIGCSNYRPRHMEWVSKMEKNRFDKLIVESRAIISHAGIGTIATALDLQKPLLVMPRLKRFGEHVNDHQVATARKFANSGHILVAYSTQELPKRIQELITFSPKSRRTEADLVVEYIKGYLEALVQRKYKKQIGYSKHLK